MTETEIFINPQMITLARESRGFSQKELADKVGISPALMCQVEQDNRQIPEDAFAKICKYLNYPEEFFGQAGESYVPASMNYRKRDTVAQKFLMPLEAQINIYRLNIELLSRKMKFPAQNIPVLDYQKIESFEKIAKELRKKWNVPKGPIENLIELAEKNGIMVISFDFGTERVDSRTILTEDKQPIIFLNKSMMGDRIRYSLAHEIGHLVMHAFTMPSFSRDISREASKFAAGLLMPESEIVKEFENGVSIPLLGELKNKWKVSMISLLYRASDFDLITENQKKYLLAQFNTLQIRRREPPELDVPKEKPRLLRDLMTKYRNAQKMSVKEMAQMMCLEQEEFIKMYSE